MALCARPMHLRTYYVDKGIESSVNKGDILKVYREKRARRGVPAVRLFIGTMQVTRSELESALGHFTPNEAAVASPLIRHKIAIKSDIVVPILVIDSGVLFDPGQMQLKPNAAAEFQKVADFVDNFAPTRLITRDTPIRMARQTPTRNYLRPGQRRCGSI